MRRPHLTLIETALIGSLLCLLCGGSALASTVTVSGKTYYVPQSTETVELADGTALVRMTLKGFVHAESPGSPFDVATQTCSGSQLMAADGTPGTGCGECEAIDGDGDIWWLWYRSEGPNSTWGFIGGTGKWAGLQGGGTHDRTATWPDGRFTGSWKGSWETR